VIRRQLVLAAGGRSGLCRPVRSCHPARRRFSYKRGRRSGGSCLSC